MGGIGDFFTGIGNYAADQQKAIAERNQGIYKRLIATRNAQSDTQRALDASAIGATQAGAQAMKGSQTAGAQANAYAGAGISVGSGSPVQAMLDTRVMSDLDVQTIKANAARSAWGYQTKAGDELSQGNIDYTGAQDQANATALTGDIALVSGWANGIQSLAGSAGGGG